MAIHNYFAVGECKAAFILGLVVTLACCAECSSIKFTGCSSSGRMPGPGGTGSCPAPLSQDQSCPVTPTYQAIQQQGKLWPCPAYTQSNGSKYYNSSCVTGNQQSLCNLNVGSPQIGCCCPLEGCWTPPNFNWILATCKGSGCGSYDGAPSTQKFKNMGSDLLVNYVASYQWDSATKMWEMAKDSSFNTDGANPAFDGAKGNGGLKGAWMQPQPGGAAAWTWGYYPAGVPGVGPPGMMFVLSVERVWNMAWYMLNQVTLDRGPAVGYPSSRCANNNNNNCWAAGNSGEIDFLESVWTVNAGTNDDYRRLYATQWNQIGRSFIGDMGSTGHADGGWFNDQATTNSYFLGSTPQTNKTVPYIFVAVVDQVGTFIYRMPATQSDSLWPGLSRKTAACTLSARPTQRPPNPGPPCDDSHPYCAIFLPNCQADEWGGQSAGHQGAANQGCKVNGQQGWCQNWWRLLDNTGQWLWPENGRKSRVQYQAPAPAVEMPWNVEMEAKLVNW